MNSTLTHTHTHSNLNLSHFRCACYATLHFTKYSEAQQLGYHIQLNVRHHQAISVRKNHI
jgi:flagellar biosynthesis GTPase FlhF